MQLEGGFRGRGRLLIPAGDVFGRERGLGISSFRGAHVFPWLFNTAGHDRNEVSRRRSTDIAASNSRRPEADCAAKKC